MKLFKLFTLVLQFCILTVNASASTSSTNSTFYVEDKFFDALKYVESSNGKYLVGDNGTAIGPYQIRAKYLKDSRLNYSLQDMYDEAKAKEVMFAYWNRYAPTDVELSYEVLARIHNGGPKGYKRKSTVEYWEKVKKAMEL